MTEPAGDELDALIAAQRAGVPEAGAGLAAVYAAAVASQDAPDPARAREARRLAARTALALGDRAAAGRHAADALAIARAGEDPAAVQADLALLAAVTGSLAEAIAALADGDPAALQASASRSPFAADPAYQAALGVAIARASREAELLDRLLGRSRPEGDMS